MLQRKAKTEKNISNVEAKTFLRSPVLVKELWFTFANIFLHSHRCWCWNPWSPWCTTRCAVLRCKQRLCHCLLEATCCWWRKPHPWIFHWQVSECAGLENSVLSMAAHSNSKKLKTYLKTWAKISSLLFSFLLLDRRKLILFCFGLP